MPLPELLLSLRFENVQVPNPQNGHVVAPTPPAIVDRAYVVSLENDLKILIEKHKALNHEVMELKKIVEKMSAKVNQVYEKIKMIVTVLSGAISRVTML